MSTLWCADCHVWWNATDTPDCFACDQPGADTRDDWRTQPARSWRNQAQWTAALEEDGA